MPGKRSQLTDKQSAFIKAYLSNGRDATAAYRSAYDTHAPAARASQEGYGLLKHPKIVPIIQEAEARAAKAIDRALDKYELTQEQVASRLAVLATSDIRNVLSWDEKGVSLKESSGLDDLSAYSIAEIREGQHGITVKLVDKRQALMDVAKLRGWVMDRSQQIGKDGKPVDPGRQNVVFEIRGLEKETEGG